MNSENNWDFLGENTKQFSHCFHKYPAMMIPQIAKRLILENKPNAKLLLDPYCGTGTSLVEAKLLNINAIGMDINPLARLISKVKTTIIDKNILLSEIIKFENIKKDSVEKIIPTITNINYWFGEKSINELGFINYYIENITNRDVMDFFKISFSDIIRDVSFVRNNEFKMYRMEYNKLISHEPNTHKLFLKNLYKNYKGMCDLMESDVKSYTKIYDLNSTDNLNVLSDIEIDIVVTSPPYGDSKTTVAYGQFSRLSSEWLMLPNAKQIDNLLMGGKKIKNSFSTNIPIIDDTINSVSKIDVNRSNEVLSFFDDYQKSINNISKLISKNGIVCYVVGNRTVKNITIPMDAITKTLFENNGFTHKNTIIRNIPNKRMPSKNSPSNITGSTQTTMLNEYIIIMKNEK